MYSLIAIFLSIPLIFSHFFGRVGADFIIENSIGHFESVKMHLFLSLLIIATLEMLWTKWRAISQSLKRHRYLFFGMIGIILFLSTYIYEYPNLRDLALGIGEKQHGLLLPIGLIWLGYLLSFLTTLERRKILYALFFSGIFISLVSLLEGVLRYDIFSGLPFVNTGSWGDIRATATLGNPNYVAGYLLMLLPLAGGYLIGWKRYIICMLMIFGILMTKSLIAISLMIAYFLGLIGYRYLGKKIYVLLPIYGLTILSLIYIATPDSEKWISLISRFVLMKYTLIGESISPISLFFGHGPDAITQIFALMRPEEVDQYFPRNSIIDSSHNIWIDIFVSYGLSGLVLCIGYMSRGWSKRDIFRKSSIVLSIIFLSLNVVVISHLIVLVWLLGDTGQERDPIVS